MCFANIISFNPWNKKNGNTWEIDIALLRNLSSEKVTSPKWYTWLKVKPQFNLWLWSSSSWHLFYAASGLSMESVGFRIVSTWRMDFRSVKQNVHRGLQSPRDNGHLVNLLLEKGECLIITQYWFWWQTEFSFLKILNWSKNISSSRHIFVF